MSDGLTVASTTDTMEEVNKAAGVEESAEEAVEQTKPEAKAEEAKEEQPERPAKPSKSSAQRRFDALTREIHELKAKLEAKETPAPEPVQQIRPEPQTSPRPSLEQYQAAGKSYEDYVEALTDWKLEQRELQKAQEEARAAETERQQAVLSGWRDQMDSAREKYEDFNETLSEQVPIYTGVQMALMEMDNGAEVAYFLGKNRDKAADLMKMSEARAMAEVGRLSAELRNGQTVSEKADSELAEEEAEAAPAPVLQRPRSHAPAPIRPVGGSATKSSVPMDELSYAEYRKLRDQQAKARYRR